MVGKSPSGHKTAPTAAHMVLIVFATFVRCFAGSWTIFDNSYGRMHASLAQDVLEMVTHNSEVLSLGFCAQTEIRGPARPAHDSA